MKKYVRNIPNASVLVNSMRSIGYDFESAVADIIDNSITAKAQFIDILFPVGDEEERYLEFIDNGIGMNRDELIEAMRFGSVKGERDKDDLGRFGLGLKTASISQCKKFTTISKKDGTINGFSWDLDVLNYNKDWIMTELSDIQMKNIPNIENYLNLESFTLVLWEKFDTLDKDLTISTTKNDIFAEKIETMNKHIALVFHRFLDSGLIIRSNYNKIQPLDPFLLKHEKTTSKAKQQLPTKDSKNNEVMVEMQVHILPYNKFLSPQDKEKIGGLDQIGKQGFYVYRNKRLMIHGTWFRIKAKSELYQNARILVDIPNTLDDLWSIDVKKQTAIIPQSILVRLRTEVEDATNNSKKIHLHQGSVQTANGSVWKRKVNEHENNSVSYVIDYKSPILKKFTKNLNDTDLESLEKMISLIELSLPYIDIYNSVAQKSQINSIDDKRHNGLLNLAIELFKENKKTKNITDNQNIDEICQYEPFLSANIKDKLKEIINE